MEEVHSVRGWTWLPRIVLGKIKQCKTWIDMANLTDLFEKVLP